MTRRRSAHSHSHHRQLIELAALLGTAGLADLFADLFGRRSSGAEVLAGLGAALVVATFVHHLSIRRAARAPSSSSVSVSVGTVPPTPAAGVASAVLDAASASGELWRIRTAVQDSPGRLAVVAGALAGVGANILSLQVHPVGGGQVLDDFVVLAPAAVDAERLAAAVVAVNGGSPHVAPAELHSLVDAPTHALSLAGRLGGSDSAAEGVGELRAVLAELLGARVDESAGEEDEGVQETRMVLRVPSSGSVGRAGSVGSADGAEAGCVLVLSRPEVPFTETEFARARAMADLAARVCGVFSCR